MRGIKPSDPPAPRWAAWLVWRLMRWRSGRPPFDEFYADYAGWVRRGRKP